MIKHTAAGSLEVTGDDAVTIEADLNAAVDSARERAMREGRHGVLVIQHGFTSYTVALSAEVPFGQTRERRQWQTAGLRGAVRRAPHP